MLFEDPADGTTWEASFINRAEIAYADLMGKFPELWSVMEQVSEISTCRVSAERVDQFFGKLEYAQGTDEEWSIWDYVFPECGSWWKRTKFTACVMICSWSGSWTPPAMIMCGWGCWCMLCDKDASPYGELFC